METFFLNFLATNYTYSKYYVCEETRCGWFQFDGGRPLPERITTSLNLIEHSDLDEYGYVYWYEPQFNA